MQYIPTNFSIVIRKAREITFTTLDAQYYQFKVLKLEVVGVISCMFLRHVRTLFLCLLIGGCILISIAYANSIKPNSKYDISNPSNAVSKTKKASQINSISSKSFLKHVSKFSKQRYSDKALTLNFQSISVRQALQSLAQFADLNMVISDKVTGTITLKLKKVPWNQVLEIILKTRGLGEEKIGNTIIIAPIDEIAEREQEELEADQQIQKLEPLHSELIQINYGKAAEMAALLNGTTAPILSARGSVNADNRTNTLWVKDTPQKLIEVRKLVKRLDVPVQQVLIQARIVNIDKKYERELGVRWNMSNSNDNSLENLDSPDTDKPLNIIPMSQRLNIDLPVSNLSQGGSSLALSLLGKGILLDLELSALQLDGNAKIIASPRLITADQKEALIESGEEIPYQEATANGGTAVAFKKAVLSLKVTPQITPDNRIILNLKVNQDKPGPVSLQGIPSIDTREIQTQVLLNNGQTVVLGGIFQKTMSNSVARTPFLSKIPLFGFLFRHTVKASKQTELLIFVTPKIIHSAAVTGTERN